MELFLDTANLTDIKRAYDFYPLCGVTTNPTIIAREKTDFTAHLGKILEIIGDSSVLHVQLIGTSASVMVDEFAALERRFPGCTLSAKIVMSEEGLKTIQTLSKSGKLTTATAVTTPMQALLAASAGASYIAPYVNRMQNISIDAVSVLESMVTAIENTDTESKLLAASFKNVQQVCDVAMVGAHSATINSEIFFQLIKHPLTDSGIEGFQRDWKAVYGDATLLDLLR